MARFEKKVAIVTGGGGGIGAATAHRLASEGAAVVVADLDLDAAEKAAAGARETGARAIAVAGNVADEDAAERIVGAAVEEFGGVDVLHNNAAALANDLIARDMDVLAIDADLFELTMSVNLLGSIWMCKHAIPSMVDRGGGAIVNMASASAIRGGQGAAVYSASKAGLASFTRSVAAEFGKRGIRCNSVSPGWTLSPRMKASFDSTHFDQVLEQVLTTRLGEPDDIAGVVAFLASDDAAYVTGQEIVADGGHTIRG